MLENIIKLFIVKNEDINVAVVELEQIKASK